MLNGMGRDRGAASALEQAILPQTVPADRRTWALAWCNLVLDCGHALGALAATGPTILANTVGLPPDVAHRATFALCAVAMLSCLVSYMALMPRIEISTRTGSFQMASRIGASSRRMITRLALLFGLDSIGGGFLNSALVAYWFFRRYGTSEADLAILFFAARSLNALPLCSVNASGDEARGRASSRVPRIIDYWTRSSPEDRGAADCLRQLYGRTRAVVLPEDHDWFDIRHVVMNCDDVDAVRAQSFQHRRRRVLEHRHVAGDHCIRIRSRECGPRIQALALIDRRSVLTQVDVRTAPMVIL
jgi:hypothetical protein